MFADGWVMKWIASGRSSRRNTVTLGQEIVLPPKAASSALRRLDWTCCDLPKVLEALFRGAPLFSTCLRSSSRTETATAERRNALADYHRGRLHGDALGASSGLPDFDAAGSAALLQQSSAAY
jgi:hypothetical protein